MLYKITITITTSKRGDDDKSERWKCMKGHIWVNIDCKVSDGVQ